MENSYNSTYIASFHDFLKKTVVTPQSGTDGRERVFAHKDMMDVTQRPNQRTAQFLDLKSLLYFAETYGSKERSIVFYTENGCVLYLDEQWRENRSTYNFETSKALQRWVTKKYDQKGFVDLLECWGADDVSAFKDDKRTLTDIMLTAYKLSLAQKISYSTTLKDMNNVHLNFEIKEEDEASENQSKTLPKNWIFKLPIFEGQEPVLVEARLNISIPKEIGQSPLFSFECLKLDSYKEKAIALLVDTIKSRLTEWQVLFAK